MLPFAFVHSFFMGSDLNSRPLRALWMVMAICYVTVLIYKLYRRSYIRGHPFKVVEVRQETQDTWSLYFEGTPIGYKPGQFMMVQLVRDGRVSEPHPFSISSSPTQRRLSISVKSVGDFTSTVGNSKTSDLAYLDAPYGVFSFLNYDDQDLIFLAGGIGITPFVSMLRYIYDTKQERKILLLWANKTEKDIVFRSELEKMEEEISSLRVVHVLSRQEDWPGEKGHISAELVKKYVNDFEKGQFFICGPPPLMDEVIRFLRGLGVNTKRIHYERFALR